MSLHQTFRDAGAYAGPIVLGLLVSAAGIAPWVVMAPINARIHPELPWAAFATLAWLGLYLAWLNGAGPPGRWKAARRYRLRLWRPGAIGFTKDGIGLTLSLMATIALLTVIWILVGSPDRPPDLTPYKSTAYVVSVVVMGALVAGVAEEAAFRGYMQIGLDRFGPGRAIVISAAMFALAHITHGWQHLLFLGPGIFVAGILYGLLARHCGSILPGMLVHFLGDLSYIYFGVLGGDWRLLILA